MDDPEFQRGPGHPPMSHTRAAGARLLVSELPAALTRPLAVMAALLADERRAAAPPPAPSAPQLSDRPPACSGAPGSVGPMSDVVASRRSHGWEGVADSRRARGVRRPHRPGERIRLREGVKLHKSFAAGSCRDVAAAQPASRRRVRTTRRITAAAAQLQHVTYEAQLAGQTRDRRGRAATDCQASTSATPTSSRQSRSGAIGRRSPWR